MSRPWGESCSKIIEGVDFVSLFFCLLIRLIRVNHTHKRKTKGTNSPKFVILTNLRLIMFQVSHLKLNGNVNSARCGVQLTI